VRALFTYAGGSGHAEPLVPFAAALREVGHAVAFAALLDDPAPQAAARRIQTEIVALPVPKSAIALLEGLLAPHC
jgi:UDP:flavonoid glycosyltransferase YjiC (YdhE family)